MITFREIWNQSASKEYSKEFKARDYIYGSELGGSIFDVWHKLKGEKPTTAPNARSYRKFSAGNAWEFIVEILLYHAGVLHESQIRVQSEPTSNKLAISGRLDFILAPGQPRKLNLEVPDFMTEFLNQFRYSDFDETILELKTVGSMIFPKREIAPAPNHKLQTYFYCSELKKPGLITYISKDDCLMAEHPVSDYEKNTQDKLNSWVETVTLYYHNNERPPKEPLIIIEGGMFSKNWHVEYSGYLDKYGFETPEHYRDAVTAKISRWNRVLKRIENGDKMTDNNKEAIDEMINEGYEEVLLKT